MVVVGGDRRWPIRWRPGGVANTEIEMHPILATKAPGIPDFGHWSLLQKKTGKKTHRIKVWPAWPRKHPMSTPFVRDSP